MAKKVKLPRGYRDMERDEYAALDIETARAVYRACLDVVGYYVDKSLVTVVPKEPKEPADWIVAVKRVVVPCTRCACTGTYCWGGTVNNVPVHSAECARCAGKGKLTFDDMRRGIAYDNHAIVRACGF